MELDERDLLLPPQDPAREAAREDFLRSFWPAGVSSSSDLMSVNLLDWVFRRLPHRPSREVLSACLSEYLKLLRDIPEDRPEELRSPNMFRASELALYYSRRSRSPSSVPAAIEIRRVGGCLLQLVVSRSGDRILAMDAYKRVRALIERLG